MIIDADDAADDDDDDGGDNDDVQKTLPKARTRCLDLLSGSPWTLGRSLLKILSLQISWTAEAESHGLKAQKKEQNFKWFMLACQKTQPYFRLL